MAKALDLAGAISADGDVLDSLVQTRRDAKAAKRLFNRLIGKFGQPRVAITDKLRSYINLIFCPRRYRLSVKTYRRARSDAFSLWVDCTAEMTA